jgi:molybdopterin-containing oxidoreductase family membrane subunit
MKNENNEDDGELMTHHNVSVEGSLHSMKQAALAERFNIMQDDLLRPVQRIGLGGKLWIGFLALVFLAGVFAFYNQETKSKYETISLSNYTMWGIYISNFVFFVALSLVGALMSAVLKLTNFEWYRPLSRIAEVIAVAAIMFAGVGIVVAMGHPERLYYLLIYGRLQSPIIWDIVVIMTYFVACTLFLFIPLIPGMALCRDRLYNKPKWQMWMYRKLSFNWEGSPEQWKLVKKCITVLAVLIIPLGISIHTVTAWLFASTLRAEWDSTNFGAYFISGAFLLGVAAVIFGTYIFRKAYHFEKYLTDAYFDKMGKMLVFLAGVYFYFNINEYLVPGFKMDSRHYHYLLDEFAGDHAVMFWFVAVFGIFVPGILPLFRSMRKPVPLAIIALFVIGAAWFKRYIIVIPGLAHPYLPIQDVPKAWLHYSPSIIEMTVVAGIFAAALLFITIFSRLFPIISIWEVAEGEGVPLDQINKMSKKS